MQILVISIFAIVISLALSLPATAKAYFAAEAEMVANCELIALVKVTAVNKQQAQGNHRKYSKVAEATVEKIWKGAAPKSILIYGGEDFICAQTPLAAGETLMFLNRDGAGYASSNWHLAIRPVKDGKVEYFDGPGLDKLSWQDLNAVEERIRKQIGPPGAISQLPADLKIVANATQLESATASGANAGKIYAAFQRAQKAALKRDQLEVILKQGTSAGKVYAALLLYKLDADAGKQAMAQLARSGAVVDLHHGSTVAQEGLFQVASELYRGGPYTGLQMR
jgi:hypothetical protein